MTTEQFLFKMLERAADKMQGPKLDPKDTVTMDTPLFIRMLELAREDIKTDVELHQVVERVLGIKDRGVLSMDDYPDIVGEEPETAPAEPIDKPLEDLDLAELRRLSGIR